MHDSDEVLTFTIVNLRIAKPINKRRKR